MSTEPHHYYMSRALTLASLGRMTVSPNPMVGCVIVRDNRVIGEGYHQKAGEAHAEIHALKAAGQQAQGATAYVTLEPCCHHGRTPPCTDALIKAGIKKVVIACQDPNPLVAGKGILALQQAGIEIEINLLQQEAIKLNEIFFHFITKKRPFVIAKWAMSLDGKMVTHPMDDRTISGETSQKNVHVTRESVDAILIGKHTAMLDNPLLTARLHKKNPAKQPIRIVLTSHGDISPDLQLLQSDIAKTIVVTTSEISEQRYAALAAKQVDILVTEANANGQVNLQHLLQLLGKRHITSLLVEGGRTVHESFFQEALVDKIDVYIAPVIIGKLNKKFSLSMRQVAELDNDIYITANYETIKEEQHHV